jgi:hypothetical protein
MPFAASVEKTDAFSIFGFMRSEWYIDANLPVPPPTLQPIIPDPPALPKGVTNARQEKSAAHLTIHHVRHIFISHALTGRRTLVDVRDAAGHSNIATTSIYLHVIVDDEGVGRLFGGEESAIREVVDCRLQGARESHSYIRCPRWEWPPGLVQDK